jgi:hypothetical protein
VADDPTLYRLSEAELNPKRPPPPPARLFWTGVYDFPWWSGNLPVWLWVAAGLTCQTLVTKGILLFAASLSGSGFLVVALAGPILAWIWITIWTGSYAGSRFLAILQDTAAGNDEITWPDTTWRENLFPFLRLAFIFACSVLAPAWLLGFVGGVLPLPPLVVQVAILAVLAVLPCVFPLFLLSSLAADSTWILLDRQVFDRFRRRPQVAAALYLHSLGLWGVSVLVGYVAGLSLLLSPVAALVWSACLLIYARLLGRVGWALTQTKGKRANSTGKKRKRKSQAATEGFPSSYSAFHH